MAYKNTDVLMAAVKQGPLANSFLRDRYFPKLEMAEFATEDVLIEYEENGQKCAPFVVPYIGGIAVQREGYTSKRFTPANIEPKIPMTIDDLMKKGFGEAIYANESPQVRADKLLAKDLLTLDEMTTRREEYMAAKVMLDHALDMDFNTGDGKKPDKRRIQFYNGDSNPYTYTPETEWNQEGATIIDDIFAMCELASSNGVRIQDLIVSPAAMNAIRSDASVRELLDNRKMNYGSIDPKALTNGANLLGILNADGYVLNLISYNDKYKGDAKKLTPFIPDGYIIAAAPAGGQRVYGAVTQMEDDNEYHTYVGDRVPKIVPDKATDKRELKMTSKPLLAPLKLGSFYSAKVVTVG